MTENPKLLDLSNLSVELERFAVERDWKQFHSPKNLVMALTGEVGELSELFQWMTEEESMSAARQPATSHKVEEELADVLLYLVRLASVLGVDLNEAARRKLEVNALKYPVSKAKGTSAKYNQI